MTLSNPLQDIGLEILRNNSPRYIVLIQLCTVICTLVAQSMFSYVGAPDRCVYNCMHVLVCGFRGGDLNILGGI